MLKASYGKSWQSLINNIRGILFLYLLINEVDGSQHMVMVEYWSRDLVLDYVHFVFAIHDLCDHCPRGPEHFTIKYVACDEE